MAGRLIDSLHAMVQIEIQKSLFNNDYTMNVTENEKYSVITIAKQYGWKGDEGMSSQTKFVACAFSVDKFPVRACHTVVLGLRKLGIIFQLSFCQVKNDPHYY